MNPEELFGKPAFVYTRAQAIRDGVLLDISAAAWECANLPTHTVITQGLWHAIAGEKPFDPADQLIRDLCYALMFAAAGLDPGEWSEASDGGEFRFEFKAGPKPLPLRMILGPGDCGDLVATLMLTHES